MPIYAVLGIMLIPFVGYYMLANDGYAISVGMPGFQNGVEVPYFLFFLCFFASFYLLKKRTVSIVEFVERYPVERNFVFALSILVLLVNTLILVAFLFAWGGISIFISDLGRGEFRANLSSGMIYYWLMKIIAPGVFAFYYLSFLRTKPYFVDKFILIINILLLLLIGASTGFKTTFITLLLPVILLYYWNASLVRFLFLSLLMILSIFLVYVAVLDDSVLQTVFDMFLQRLFIAQSDVSWHIWNLYLSDESFPNYFRSLMSVFGSKFVYAMTGVDRSNLDQWIYYDYNSLLMVIAGLPVSVIEEGHNITGGLFTESLIALGIIGIPLFSMASGFFVAFIYNSIQKNVRGGRFIYASMLATYFAIFILPALWGGGVITFLHLSTAIGFFVLFITLSVMSLVARRVRFVSRRTRITHTFNSSNEIVKI